MANGTIANIAASVAGELGLSTGSAILERVLKRRREDARDILMERVRVGEILLETAEAEDEAVAMMFRYFRAANEGTARAALRLMASALRGELLQPRAAADSFQRWADILSSLSRNEIQLLAEMYAQRLFLLSVNTTESLEIGVMNRVRERVVGEGRAFETEEHLTVTLVSLTRTGLVVSESAWGGNVYRTSILMDALVSLIGQEQFADDINASNGS